MSHSTIYACVILEILSKDKFTLSSSKTVKNAIISSVKNENHIFIKISATDNKSKFAPVCYPVVDVMVYEKFVQDGKATIKLPKSSVQILINNCPPSDLKLFLTTLKVKLNSNISSNEELRKTKSLNKILPSSVSALDVISPICKSDVKKMKERKMKDSQSVKPSTPEKKRKMTFTDEDFTTPPSHKLKLQHFNSTPNSNILKELNIPKEVFKKSASVMDDSLNESFQLNEYYKLTNEQIEIIEKVKLGDNVFYTGSAGTGKTFLLKKIIGILPPQTTIITASTGVAASLIDGCTLHSFAGIGTVIKSVTISVDMIMKKPQILLQWRKCKHLIIDEISLISAEFFDHLDQIGRVIRNVPNLPFGGIQLIVSGDFFQLPPVSIKGSNEKKSYKFAFQSHAWNDAFPEVLFLTQVKRQSDAEFVKLLAEIRVGRCPEWVDKALKATANQRIEKNGILPTQLCTHKVDVENKNQVHLDSLKGESIVYAAQDSVPDKELYLRDLCPAELKLSLKIGAQVMLIKNIDVQNGMANGARGVVIKFDWNSKNQYPTVRFTSGKTCEIKPELFSVNITVAGNKMVVIRRQLPLKLAYAISVHKSQGMTLDCVDLYLANIFECGQAYVALSRCKSIDSMRVIDWHKNCVKVDNEVLNFYKQQQTTKDFF